MRRTVGSDRAAAPEVGPRWVVIGGLGFVGQRLCEMLLERDDACAVVAFDRGLPPPDLHPRMYVS